MEYIVAHGISTTIEGKKAVIGSYHFVFEDENSVIPKGMEEKFSRLPAEYSHLYLAIEGVLAAVICIEDPLRPEAAEIVRQLKKAGLKKIVMMRKRCRMGFVLELIFVVKIVRDGVGLWHC